MSNHAEMFATIRKAKWSSAAQIRPKGKDFKKRNKWGALINNERLNDSESYLLEFNFRGSKLSLLSVAHQMLE